MRRIGFVGLGAMGSRMTARLLGAQFDVCGYDISEAARDSLVAAGGRAANTAAEACEGAEALVLMVVNAAQAEAVLFEAGALERMAPRGIVLLTATCPPRAVAAIAARVEAAGRRFVDAPVSGGTKGAEAGTLTIMIGAKQATFDDARPVLAALGGKLVHVGEEPGQGATLKTINQLLCGVHIAAAAEAFSLASRAGLDRRLVLDVLGGSAAASWMLNDRGPRMLQADPPVASAVDIFVKDLALVLEAGRDARAALPLAAIAHQLFLATAGRGDGGADDSQVLRSYDALNGS